MKKLLLLIGAFLMGLLFVGCSMSAADYYMQGNKELKAYDCGSDTSYAIAADMEFEDEGNWYPVYMLSLGQSRAYCGDFSGSLTAFQTVDQFTVKKSQISDVEAGIDFLKASAKRMYELTEREETLLHFYMGFTNYKLGNYEDALIEIKKTDYIAEGTYAALPLSSLMRGLIYLKLGEKDNAIVAFRKIIEANPHSPLGYKLLILNDTDPTQREYYINCLKDSCNENFEYPNDNEKPVITILDCTIKLDDDYAVDMLYNNNIKSSAYLFDLVDPEFDFGAFTGKLLKEMASSMGREVLSRLSFGLSGLFLGDSNSDARNWASLPTLYMVDLVYLGDENYLVEINHYEENELKKSRQLNLNVKDYDLFVVRF